MGIIYLIGARGCGKTTVGKHLAEQLSLPFTDLDIYLTQKAGKSIADIVSESGWEAFRSLETSCLREVTENYAPNGVIATGGGIICSPKNSELMRAHGTVFWLSAPAHVLKSRLESNPDHAQRPSLTGKGLLEEITQILADREELYKSCAHWILDGAAEKQKICASMIQYLTGSQNQG